METIAAFFTGIVMAVGGFLGIYSEDSVGAPTRVLSSAQIGTDPQADYILSTNGATSTWIANTGSSGASSTIITLNDGSQENVGVPTLDFDTTEIAVTESPADEFNISVANDITFDSATITDATSTNTHVSGNFSFGGVIGNAWTDFCTTITGSADLCDGSDDGGGGGTGSVGTSTPDVDTYVTYFTSTGATPATIGGEAAFTYDDSTNTLTADTFVGALTGNADTATALAANGANCSAGSAPLGVDASGAVESCTDFEEDLSNEAGLYAALSDVTNFLQTGDALDGTDVSNADLGDISVLSGSWTLDSGVVDTTALTDDSISEVDLDVTNAATDNYVLSYDSGSNGFTWVADQTGDSGSLSTTTDNNPQVGEEISYITTDFYIGGSASNTAEFNFDKDGARFTISSTTASGGTINVDGANIIDSTSGSATFDFIDVLGSTAEATIEGAIDTLANLTSWGGFTWNPADAGADAFLGWDDTAGQYENLTAGEALTIVGGAANDFDASGDVTVGTAEITDNTIIEPDLNVDDTPTDGDILTYDSTGTNFVWETILDLVNLITGAVDWGGITSFEIPNGTNPTTDATGEMALDTTDNQLIVDDGTNDLIYRGEDVIFKTTIASTSVEFVSGGVIPLPPEKDGFALTKYRCYVIGGTSVVVNLSDGTNDTETITCATTLTSDDDVATNDTFTAGELAEIQIGTITGSPDYLSFTAYGLWTRE